MTIRSNDPRRAAFFAALRATGNITIAAERARLRRSWVEQRRSRDGDFDQACRTAIAAAAESLADAGDATPKRGWGSLDGAELVVRGAPGRRTQIRRAPSNGWSPAIENRFLAVLGATCNVKAACDAVALTQGAAYYHRRRWPAFAARWAEALETGYIRLEAALIENACNVFSGTEQPAEMPMPPVGVADAIQLLRLHRHGVHGVGKRTGGRPARISAEAARAAILRNVAALTRAQALRHQNTA